MRFHLAFYVLLFTFYVLITPTSTQVRFTDVTDVSGLGDFTAVYTTWGYYENRVKWFVVAQFIARY